ncbi:MAG: ATP-dependent RNA helicase HrpA [Pseudomonadota bacterium]
MPTLTPEKISTLLAHAFPADRRRIGKKLAELRRLSENGAAPATLAQQLAPLERQARDSVRRRRARIAGRPQPVVSSALPISGKRDEIIAAIRRHPVVIISGETGSGKTTQIPQYCLAAGRGIDGIIGCTQPRRIAATSVARRIAEELDVAPGTAVGYKIRFQEQLSAGTYIKIMTDGILLAEAQGDPRLQHYDTLIVDEAHERSLNIDFILGILKRLINRRKDLRLIITSATIDTEKFAAAFGGAPIIEVSGRMYPVDVRYMPMGDEDADPEGGHVEAAVKALDDLIAGSARGDVLIFMPTEQGIRETCDAIAGRRYRHVTVMPLFARLSGADQARVFASAPGRKVIVATNIAETSITIPGIRYVIDTGLARISQYMPRSRTTALPVSPISRSSADQRMGRCGRVEDGVCIRLYAEDDYTARPRFTPPEILRANLADVILRMTALGLGDPAVFPFIDPPAAPRIRDGVDLLLELGAIQQVPAAADTGRRRTRGGPGYRLTDQGRLMAQIPVDPRLSRVMIAAGESGCLPEVVIIAAVLSISDPRERPAEKEKEADAAQRVFRDPQSDFVTLLNIWKDYHRHSGSAGTAGQMKRWCQTHFISTKRMREWRDLVRQLQEIAADAGMDAGGPAPVEPPAADSPGEQPTYTDRYARLHRALLSGFLSNIALKREGNLYGAARGKEVMVFPGSGLFGSAPRWIVAAEMVETSRLFARVCAGIDHRWLEPLGGALCKSTHQNPRWERSRGEVVADEQVTLFGLVIVSGRRVPFGRLNPDKATEIFINDALVAGDVREPLPFMVHNRDLMDTLEDMEHRTRRRDVLVTPEEMAAFYRDRLDGVCDLRTLKRMIRTRGEDDFLRMQPEDLLRYRPGPEELARYPDRLDAGGQSFACSYRFDPGTPEDGLTVHIPSPLASAVTPETLEWLVPGLLAEKVSELIRGLPKAYRRRLVPVTDRVDTICREMTPRTDRPLAEVLGRFIRERFGIDIPATAWQLERLPEHLKARIAISGPDGDAIAVSRDTAVLERHPGTPLPEARLSDLKHRWECTGLTPETFPDLPERIALPAAGEGWAVFPAIVEEDDGLAVRILADSTQAAAAHKTGVRALYRAWFQKDIGFLKKRLRLSGLTPAMTRPFGGSAELERRLVDAVLNRLFARDIRTGEAFRAHGELVASTFMDQGQDLLAHCQRVVAAHAETVQALSALRRAHAGVAPLVDRLENALSRLVPPQFVSLYDADRLVHLPRYLAAMVIRARRAAADPVKEQQKAGAIDRHEDRLKEMIGDLTPATTPEKRATVEAYFWMIEEFKVSVFAQELGTAEKVSEKRLERLAADIRGMI